VAVAAEAAKKAVAVAAANQNYKKRLLSLNMIKTWTS